MRSTTVLETKPALNGRIDPVIPDVGHLIEARSVTRVWGKGDSAQVAVDNVDLSIVAGELLAVVGPSGSGKSTLGSLIAGLDRPTSGSIMMDSVRLDRMKEDALAGWRANNVGIVFQNFHLVPTLTAAENVSLSLRFGPRVRNRKQLVQGALEVVGLGQKA
ncbi:MAG: ABC transporter ATP-binding protein, partial [Acidimicrobiales bacterium]